jgi:hypothetical protein
MKILSPIRHPGSEDEDKKIARVSERPLRICVAFDEDASGRSAEILIKHVASDHRCERQSFRFDELDPPVHSVAAARSAADTDVLMLAIRGDRMPPAYIQFWLGLCLGLREEDQEGAFVALITQPAETADLHSSLMEYLETVATIGGLAFFPWQHSIPDASSSDSAPTGLTSTAPATIERFCLPRPQVD